MSNTLVKTNVDEKCAEYGFRICDYVIEIYETLNKKLRIYKEEASTTNLIEIAKKIFESVVNALSPSVKDFENYVRIDNLRELTKVAEKLQNSEMSDDEKIVKLTEERKFSEFARECENSLRKTLGILSADGVFASIIWIEAKDDKYYRAIKYQISKFLQEVFIVDSKFSGDPNNLRNEILKICSDIFQMFFVKQILEQMLTYALYRARSLR